MNPNAASRSVLLIALVLLAGSVVAACSTTREPDFSTVARSAVADSVAQSTRDFAAAFSKLDPQALNAFLRSDGEFRGYYGNGRFETYQDLRHQDSPFAGTRAGEVRIDSMHVAVLSPKAAVVSAYAYGTWTDTAGRVERFNEWITYVWTREPDGWKILHFHPSERRDSSR